MKYVLCVSFFNKRKPTDERATACSSSGPPAVPGCAFWYVSVSFCYTENQERPAFKILIRTARISKTMMSRVVDL